MKLTVLTQAYIAFLSGLAMIIHAQLCKSCNTRTVNHGELLKKDEKGLEVELFTHH